MSPKKKKRPQAAQALIDELLDEKSSQPKRSDSREYDSEPVFLQVDDSPRATTGIPSESDFPSAEIRLDDIDGSLGNLSLDISKPHQLDPIAAAGKTALSERTRLQTRVASVPESKKKSEPAPFDGTNPLVTQMAKRDESVSEFPDLRLDDLPDLGGEPEVHVQGQGIDQTVRIKTPASAPVDPDLRPVRDIRMSKPKEPAKPVDRGGVTEIHGGGLKASASPAQSNQANAISAASAVFASSEAALKQSESLRIAQTRISELEQELERIRRENEDLAAAGETLRRRADELISKTENLDIKERETHRIADEERKVLRGQMQAKDRENAELRARVEEIELRLESNFKKIRVRERELEHRLEIVKMESQTLVSTKDKMILELKRQLDQLVHENDHAKAKSQEMFGQYKDKQETIRRVVRALRIALTILEGDDETVGPLKKAD